MSRRYATIQNLQADQDEIGQRAKFARPIPGRTGDAPKLGAADYTVKDGLQRAFPKMSTELVGYDPAAIFSDADNDHSITPSIPANANPDFASQVNLDFSSASFEEDLFEKLNTTDKIQAGAPNVSTGDMRTPGERGDYVVIPRREAGFGTREIDGVNVNKPSDTRESIGNYFETHERGLGRGLGTSKPQNL